MSEVSKSCALRRRLPSMRLASKSFGLTAISRRNACSAAPVSPTPSNARPVRRIQGRQPGVELHRFFELFLRRRIRQFVQVGNREQEMRFGGITSAEDAIDVALSVMLVLSLEQCHAEHIRERQILVEQRFARLQERHDVGRAPNLEVAVAQQQ